MTIEEWTITSMFIAAAALHTFVLVPNAEDTNYSVDSLLLVMCTHHSLVSAVTSSAFNLDAHERCGSLFSIVLPGHPHVFG